MSADLNPGSARQISYVVPAFSSSRHHTDSHWQFVRHESRFRVLAAARSARSLATAAITPRALGDGLDDEHDVEPPLDQFLGDVGLSGELRSCSRAPSLITSPSLQFGTA